RETRDMMIRQVDHVVRLVDDLLDVARLSRGLVVLRKETVTVADLLARAAEAARPVLERRRHVLEVVAPGSERIEADAVRITQVLSTLLDNAGKYAGEGGHIWLSAACEGPGGGREMTLRVRDDGMGIRPELLPRIFEPLAQGDRPGNRLREGLGLGLA